MTKTLEDKSEVVNDRDYEPTISVIIPLRNAEATLAECIDSLIDVDYPIEKLEIVFVNNGSTDRSRMILDRYQANIVVLDEPKKGLATARNRGITHSTNEIVVFTDADCIVDRQWLGQLIGPLADKRVGISGGQIRAKRPCNPIQEFGEKIHNIEKAITVFKPPYVTTANWASRRQVLEELGKFDENFDRGSEDTDLSFTVYDAGYTLSYVSEAVVYHRNENNLWGLFRQGYAHGFRSVKLLRKHHRLVGRFGHRRVAPNSYRRICRSFSAVLRGHDAPYSTCDFVFNAAKKIGKLCGSLRYCYLEL